MKFKWLTGDMNWKDYGGKWISPRYHHEFNYWYVLTITNLLDAVGDREANEMGGDYMVDCKVVAPEEFAEKDSAVKSCGYDQDPNFKWEKLTDEQKVEIIESYAGGANIYSGIGNNYKKLFKAARKAADETELFFGFKMDAPQNKIGSTGWDFLKGDTLGGLNRYVAAGKSGDTTMDIMRKMHGK